MKWGEMNTTTIQNVINSYRELKNKTIYVFLVSDCCDCFNIPDNVRLYRTSLYRSKQSKNEYLLPYIWENITIPVAPLERGEYPIVGFCGLNSKFRQATLTTFMSNKNVKCNFILRNQFWAGTPNDPVVIKDFNDNMINSHFNICNRGNGNFSMRFYQTLSCGRIPVLLNTDMILPFSDEIDWESLIVLANTESELVVKLLDYWNNRDIIQMQVKCKDIYNKYFLASKFFDKILSDKILS